MKQGHHVNATGIDGFYVFLKEVQGTASLRVGGAKGPDKPTLAIAMDQVVSLEKIKIGSLAWPGRPMGSRRDGAQSQFNDVHIQPRVEPMTPHVNGNSRKGQEGQRFGGNQ